ncbi:MAG TPA: hypothetical protein DDZ68_03830 [Parvularcula sp.]|nr:hypothetical protein [Parvularcula sp.]
MLCPDSGEALECARNVAHLQGYLARLHLHIDTVGRPVQFYVLIAFYDDFGDIRCPRTEEAIRDIEVLIQESTMNRFDTNQLARIKHI